MINNGKNVNKYGKSICDPFDDRNKFTKNHKYIFENTIKFVWNYNN